MIVSRLILKNWKNFASVDLLLEPRVFLVGPNASGKSNLMDALLFLKSIVAMRGGLQEAIIDRGGLTQIRSFFAEKDEPLEIQIWLSDCAGDKVPAWRYSIALHQTDEEIDEEKEKIEKVEKNQEKRAPRLAWEKVWQGEKLIISRPDKEDRRFPERLEQTYLESKTSHQQFRDVAKFLQSVQYHCFIPQLLQSPQAFSASGASSAPAASAQPTAADDPFGRWLLQRMQGTPENIREERLKKIEAVLRATVPQLQHVSLIRDEATQAPHLESHFEFEDHIAGSMGLREDRLSGGTLRLIALFWSMLDDSSSLLLLEEPEVSLPAAIVRRLAAEIYLCKSSKKPPQQVWVSTHSFELLSDPGIGGEETVVLEPGRRGTTASIASSIPEIRALLQAGFSVGEAALPRAERSIARKDF